jgi:hypothetical protein
MVWFYINYFKAIKYITNVKKLVSLSLGGRGIKALNPKCHSLLSWIYIDIFSPKTLNNILMKFNKSVAFVTLKF